MAFTRRRDTKSCKPSGLPSRLMIDVVEMFPSRKIVSPGEPPVLWALENIA
jgi:hypothetical protein